LVKASGWRAIMRARFAVEELVDRATVDRDVAFASFQEHARHRTLAAAVP